MIACSTQPSSTQTQGSQRTVISDASSRGLGLWKWNYVGKWEFVHFKRDGRSLGTSSRSFHKGSILSVAFAGKRVRLYGVLGTKGGYGLLAIDDTDAYSRVSFYAPSKRTHALVYESPPLKAGNHALAIIVTGKRPPGSSGTFVNVEDIEVER